MVSGGLSSISRMAQSFLYYGDNLDVLQRYVKDESVDLVYLDPPFNSARNFNVLFADQHGARAAAQIKAFEDTWRWDQASMQAYTEVVEGGGGVAHALKAIRDLLGDSDMTAYLAMMAPRLKELHRVLKPTGSMYLHSDPTASHYLKVLMDAVFDPRNFRNEISWKRFSAKNDPNRFGRSHDVLLFYTKSNKFTWNVQYGPFEEDYVQENYRYVEEGTGRRYRRGDLTAAKPGGDVDYEWHGARPYKGRHWAFSRENMDKMLAEGRIEFRKTGMPVYKRYLDEQPGVPLQDIWTDIRLHAGSRERLGYPTQKPEALLARIICASSNEGDVVLDPFCGCGTTIAVAQKLKRRWIGIDITHLAVTLMKHRLQDLYGPGISAEYRVLGEPVALDDAAALAQSDPYQFQWWALGLVGARPAEGKKGADRGIDGRIYFHDEGGGKTKQIILSVKAGKTNPAHVRDLRGVLDREGAQIGVLLTMQPPTQPMRTEAAGAGMYESPGWGRHYPRIQIITVQDLLEGKEIAYPHQTGTTFKAAVPVEEEEGPPQEEQLFEWG